ncbi:MAG: hypothetical protein JSS57_13515 [Proteobacteria bacterium]|nr:hypothetical protein [Pseudomonadota bacterium]
MSVDVIQEALESVRDDIREIKSAISKMAEAVVRLAVLEEKQSTQAQAQERAFGAISKLEARVRDLEQSQPVQKLTAGWVVSAVWCAVGVLATLALKSAGVL